MWEHAHSNAMTEPSQPKRISRRDVLRWAGAGTLTALLGGSVGLIESSDVKLEKHELRLPKWDADGFRVAVLSDIHANDAVAAARAARAVQMAIEQKPDLIVLPGDFVNFSWPSVLTTMTGALEDLHQAKCPVIGTMGNHDYWTDNPRAVMEAIRSKTRIQLLRNESVDIGSIAVAGVDDAIANAHQPDFIAKLENKSLLVLFHEPDFVRTVPKNASLQISGHSHGGQMCLPFGVPLHTPYGSWKYQKGFYPDATVPLYVTRGIGCVGAPVRLFCPPEVSLLTLRNAV